MTLRYEEKFGSLYLYDGNNIVRMVDGTDEIAFAFNRETFEVVKSGSLKTVEAWAKKANEAFQGSWEICTLSFHKGFDITIINKILATRHVGFLVKTTLPQTQATIQADSNHRDE